MRYRIRRPSRPLHGVIQITLLGLILLGGVPPSAALPLLGLEGFSVHSLITTADDPANHVVTPPSFLDGVASLRVSGPGGTFGCSGSYLAGTRHVLTAAHCVDLNGDGVPDLGYSSATFFPGGPSVSFSGVNYYVPSSWDGDFRNGSDIALIELADDPSRFGIAGYTIATADPTATGTVQGNLAGYGRSGTGASGDTLPFGTLREGSNLFGESFWTIDGFPYAYDFDNGLAANDAFCILSGGSTCDLGLGSGLEALIAPGDSGGPTFIAGLLAGVHSFGASFGIGGGDIDDTLNSSFGEIGGDTRVSAFASWIDGLTASVPQTAASPSSPVAGKGKAPVPEPGILSLTLLGLVMLCLQGCQRGLGA